MTRVAMQDAGVRADAWHAVFAAEAAVDDVVDAAGEAKMTFRPLRACVYTCDK